MFPNGRRLIRTGLALALAVAVAVPALAQQSKTPAKAPAPRSTARTPAKAATPARPVARPAAPVAKPAAPVAAPKAATSAFGRVAGKVTARGEAVPFANVIVLGTKQGTQADENGNYVLVGVPVGEVQIRAMATGYDPSVQRVTVNAGATVTLNFAFGEQRVVKELPTIEVSAQKRIDTKSSTTKQTITADKLKEIPVDNLREAVAVKAGIVAYGGELHFRGGRGGEVKFQFDGVEVSDPLLGRGANIANLAVAGTDVLSGGFDAEYGNALSGVVSVSTKEGTDRFGGEVRWDTDRFGDPTKTFDNYDRFTFGFGGPTPIKNLTYFATYEGTFQDSYLKSVMTHPRRTFIDFIQLGNRQFNQINTNLKLAYRINPRNKVTFETINNRTINTPYNHMWSRKGFVQVSYDTVRVAGQPDTYRPRYGTWSATQKDSTYQYVNMADHVTTTGRPLQPADDRVDQPDLGQGGVVHARLEHELQHARRRSGRRSPGSTGSRAPFYWSGNVSTGTENNLVYATHGDYPYYAKRDQSTWTLKSDYSTQALEAAHGQDRHRGQVQRGEEPDAAAAELGSRRAARRGALGLHRTTIPRAPPTCRTAGSSRAWCSTPASATTCSRPGCRCPRRT